MIRFRSLLIRFFTQRPCLDLRCQALTYLRSGLAWTSAARPLLTYLLRAANAPRGCFGVPICFFVSANQIPGLGFLVRKMTKKTACFTLSSWTIRAIVTLFAARCAYVFGTLKVNRRLVRSITTCRTRSRWASLFIMTSFFAECTDCCGQLFLLCPFGSSAPLHFEHLCSGHAKLLEFRWSELPHALHRG